MTEMDALRLRIAARAYRATRPDEGEVERGVRRAMSAMRRSQIRRRHSLTPAIVVAILAFGTLAYANPNNVRRWMAALLSTASDTVSEQVTARMSTIRSQRPEAVVAQQPSAPAEPAIAAAPVAPAASELPASEPVAAQPVAALRAQPARAGKASSSGRAQRATWAEVNSALGAQDTPRALAALGDLSRHGDAATRANAQLGIAQLLWSRGDRGTACSIARTLIEQKSAPPRVQERARALAQGCKP
jgi:hypothetical protein